MSAHHGRKLGFPDLLSFDMGGTTAKGALVRNFTALKQYDLEVGRVHEFKSGSGLPAKLPVIDMIEIASGGGSLAQVDERGLIRVGPKSADPGPACYAKGGTRPTLTDADVVLGYLDPEFFLGGEMRLDADAARAAIEAHVARPAGLDPICAAWGVHEIANEDVARAFRIHDWERNHRLPEVVDGCVRRFGPRARARDRPQAPDPARHLSHRGGRDVGTRVAREPARLRDLAFAPHLAGRSRRANSSRRPSCTMGVEPHRRRATVATRRGNTPCASPPP